MSQKGRISLSHAQAMAMQAPLGIEGQLAEARAKAREGIQLDIEDAIRAEETRESFKKLAAPPSAQKRVSALKQQDKLGEMPGWMASIRRKGREAKPPTRLEATSNDPTPERKAKESYGWVALAEVGGQVRHRARDFVEQYGDHLKDMSDAERSAAGLLIAGWESAEKAQRMVSDRAYTGKPFVGGETSRSHLDNYNAEQLAKYLDDAALFEEAHAEMTRNTMRWWRILLNVILRESGNRDKPMGPYEIGVSLTAYKARETATAAGVVATKLALIRWLEALQTAMARRGQRQRRRAEMQADLARVITDEVQRKRVAKGNGR